MSAILLPAPSPRLRSTRLRLTARGRAVLLTLAALPAIAIIAISVLGGGSALASLEDGVPAGTFQTVTVMPGESLWSIAQEIAPDEDPRDVVADIERLNGMSGGIVAAGQRLAIPAEYASAP
ncbi:hypothetical protein GCM10009808_12050 [Microbacterium sediminicola]|uniref:LysM domain-containing protein n=2 Tax=Microbacterium sediminicola TaxID=415210 RepID=A0ABP4TZ70_9MICO